MCAYGTRVSRIAIVGVDDVAGGAAAGTVIARMIVGAWQGKDRIEQAGFLEAEENRVGAQFGAEAAIAELVVGLAGIFFAIGITEFGFLSRRLVRRRAGCCRVGIVPNDREA